MPCKPAAILPIVVQLVYRLISSKLFLEIQMNETGSSTLECTLPNVLKGMQAVQCRCFVLTLKSLSSRERILMSMKSNHEDEAPYLLCSGSSTIPNQNAMMEDMMRNPDSMKAMQSMMSSLKPEDIAAMQRQASSLGSGHGSQQDQMMAMMKNPETMNMMQNIMGKMKPEDISALQKQAAGFQGGLGSQSEHMQKMMSDPGTLKAMQGMMSDIDPSELSAMYRQAGMNISEEQVCCLSLMNHQSFLIKGNPSANKRNNKQNQGFWKPGTPDCISPSEAPLLM